MSEPTHQDEWNAVGRVATVVHEQDRPTHSQILGPDGKPLAYERPPVGFDLRPTSRNRTEQKDKGQC